MAKDDARSVRRLSWLRDPLFVFLVIGAAVFGVDQVLQRNDSRTVLVTPAQTERMAALWTTQMGRAPTATELNALIDDHVREEILVREAKRLRLDEGDVIVRRRLAQKLSFLSEDLTALEPPSEAELRRYFEANRARYETPATVSFSHVYFSPDRREDAAADARSTLVGLDAETWRRAGDPFLLGRTYAYASMVRVRKDFGDAFADALAALQAGPAWQGPLQSSYGFHLLRVDGRTPGAGADYESVAQRVATDFDAERRAEANRRYFDDLLAEYTVQRP